MGEVVGVIASVTQLVQISGTLLAGGYGFLSRVSKAPSELRTLLAETAAINSILEQLQIIANSTPKPISPNDALKALERLGVFQECQRTIKSIQKALDICEQVHGRDVGNFGRRLMWPFKEKETKDALQQLHRLRGLLANAIETNSASALRRIETTQGQVVDEVTFISQYSRTQMDHEDMRTVLSWLCPSSADGAHISLENASSRRLHGTGAWFFDSYQFKDWAKSRFGTMWISGLPGSGKTLLCSSVIEKMREVSSPTTAVLFFFCDHRDVSKTTLKDFLMNIIKQVIDVSPACLTKAKELYKEKGKKLGRTLNETEYLELVKSFLVEFEEWSVIVDALDEAAEADPIADALKQMHASESTSVRVMFTSRFDIRLERKYSSICSIRIALAENTRHDIEHCVNTELLNRVTRGAIKLRDKSLITMLQSQIGLRAGTLLQAQLQLDYLSTAKNDKQIKDMIQNLPDGLDYTYETLLCSTAVRYPTRVHQMRLLLRCLVCAISPLSASQLSEVMAMEPGQRYLDFDSVMTDPYDALEVIAPFVTIHQEHHNGGYIKLSHYSLNEYLCSERILRGRASGFHVDVKEVNAWFTSVCLQCLTFSVFDDPLDNINIESNLDSKYAYTLLPYAASNWFSHMYKANGLPDFELRYQPYLSWFVNGHEGTTCYNAWQQVYFEANPYVEASFNSPICFAIRCSLNELFEYLLPTVPGIDHRFEDGFTCLTVAAMCANTPVVQSLLDLGAYVDQKTTGRELTPLHLAAEFGSSDVFDLLMNAGADPHARSASKTTPFYRAARGGDIRILRQLKDCGSDVNALTFDKSTPILEAVEHGNQDVVQLLIEWGADLTVCSEQGCTPFTIAEDVCNYSILQLLQAAVSGPGVEGMET